MTAYLKHKNEEDEEEKEMISLIPEIIALLGGIVSAVLIALPLNSYIDPLVGDALGSIVIAPLVEEPAKMIGIIILALYYPYSIIGKKRGLILGALAGLGFAFTENFFYAVIYPTAPVVRAIIPPLGHICDSAIAAIGIALISQKNIHRPLTDLRSILVAINTKETRTFFIIAMSFHALNNLILTIIGAPFSTVFWVANLIAGYLVLYKLYTYLPEKLNKIKLSGPISLITEAIHFNRKEDQKAFKTN